VERGWGRKKKEEDREGYQEESEQFG